MEKYKFLVLISLLLMSLLVSACGTSVEKWNKQGNEAFSKQMYEEALRAYQAAEIENPELGEPYYNAANTLYRQGNYTQAIKQLNIALSYAEDEIFEQSGQFNLGNSAFNSQQLDAAVESYKAALLIDPKDQDAKYNLELALQQKNQQEEQQEQQTQDQQEQQEQQQNQDQNSTGENSEQEQNQSSGGNVDNQNEQEGQDTENQQDLESEGQQSQESDGENPQQNQDGQQHQSEEQGDQGTLSNEEGSDNQNPSPNSGQIPAPGQRMTKEQAEQLLAAIAQDMETLQERLGQVLFVQDLPPEQDW